MKLPLLALLLTGASSMAVAECLEHSGLQKSKDGDVTEAFEDLRDCENDPAASAAALFTLAYLHNTENYAGLTASELALKTWDLLEKAALTGDEDAVVTLASMYGVGDAELGFEPEPDVQNCLLSTTEDPKARNGKGPIHRAAIMQCLTKEPARP